MEKTIRIFLIDDHQMFLEGVFSILNEVTHIEIVGTAKNGNEALKRIPSLDVDIAITDIEMPEMDGLQLTKAVKKLIPEVKVIIASSHAKSNIIEKAKKYNANGYILKNTGKIELLKAIHSVFENEFYFSEEVKKIHNDSLFSSKKTSEALVTLSPREKDVLKLITEEKKTQNIAEELCISINTVETHRKNLMRKIGTKNVVGLVKYAIQQGLV